VSLANYSDLQASVLSWLNRDSAGIPVTDFISIAEAELNSKVRVRQNTTTTTLTLAQGGYTVSLPSDFLEDVELNYEDLTEPLNRASFNDVDYLLGNAQTGRPELYAFAGSVITFEKLADQAYDYTLRYYRKWDIAVEDTNWLLSNHPDAYLFGALLEANAWLGDMNQANYCRERRDAAVLRALTADSRTRGGTLKVDAALVRPGRYNILTD
jgi:hypothetical protein